MDVMWKKAKSKKKTRDRKPSGERDPVSHRRKPDNGTQQLRAYRAMLIGPAKDPEYDRPLDPAMATDPLGICFGRGLVTLEQHTYGRLYADLYGRLFRAPHVSAQNLAEPKPPFDPTRAAYFNELREERTEEAFQQMRGILLDCGRRTLDVVENVVVFGDLVNRFPGFLDLWANKTPAARTADARDLLALKEGLQALVDAMERGRRR